jgi:hypothetical protein
MQYEFYFYPPAFLSYFTQTRKHLIVNRERALSDSKTPP